MSGGSAVPPPEVGDWLAYASGFIDGKAARSRARAAVAWDAATDDRGAVTPNEAGQDSLIAATIRLCHAPVRRLFDFCSGDSVRECTRRRSVLPIGYRTGHTASSS
jgi:hypothetical protein